MHLYILYSAGSAACWRHSPELPNRWARGQGILGRARGRNWGWGWGWGRNRNGRLGTARGQKHAIKITMTSCAILAAVVFAACSSRAAESDVHTPQHATWHDMYADQHAPLNCLSHGLVEGQG